MDPRDRFPNISKYFDRRHSEKALAKVDGIPFGIIPFLLVCFFACRRFIWGGMDLQSIQELDQLGRVMEISVSNLKMTKFIAGYAD